MTSAENERLAVVENEVKNIKDAVGELGKTVAAFDGKLDGVLLYIAGEKGANSERRRESQTIRWALTVFIPAIISLAGFLAGRLLH